MRGIVRLVITTGTAAGVLAAAGSAAALNPQPLPPRVFGVVRDACTGLPVAGATVTLGSPTGAEVGPGSSQTGPLGRFGIGGVAAGVYAFAVSAPGYDPLGVGPGSSQAPGSAGPGPIQITVDPGLQLAGGAAAESVDASILLAPTVCRPPNPNFHPPNPNLPALSGIVRSAATGLPIVDATETLTPASGEINPGPISLLGAFAWPTLDAGTYALAVAAPGYLPAGDPASGSPALQITVSPGPIGFADGGSVSFGDLLDILLTRTDRQ